MEYELEQEEDIYNTWNMWKYLNVPYASYNISIDRKLIDIMQINIEDRENSYSSIVAKKLNIDEDFVELIYGILCGTNLWDYGTSPRGCWPIDEEKCKNLLEKCKKYYYIHWIKKED
jgi:hypothetical protein